MLSVAALLGSCSKDGVDDNGQAAYDASKSVTFTTTTPGKAVTRGTPITDVAGLASMGAFCSYTGMADWTSGDDFDKMFNQRLDNVSGTWTYPSGQEKYWEAASMADRYTFFAYTPYATASNGITVQGTASTQGTPTLTYTVPSGSDAAIAAQPDLMVAVARKNVRPTGNPVALEMKHALTSVGFRIGAEDAGKKLTGIVVSGVSITGTLTMDGGWDTGDGGPIKWSGLGAPAATNFSALINKDTGEEYFTIPTGSTALALADNGYLMMIPQTLTAAAKVTLTFDGADDITIELGTHTWEAGKKVIYSISLAADGVIVVSPEDVVLPWVAGVTGNFRVDCQDGDGAEADLPWSFSIPAAVDWLLMSKNADGSGAAKTLTGSGTATIYLVSTENGATDRTTTIELDGTIQEVTVKQLKKVETGSIPGGGTVMANSYVGAFWRAEQTGERVIKTANTGGWTACVAWMDDNWDEGDIVLAAGLGDSEDILYTAAPGDAEVYQVTDGIAAASGTGEVLFRIGLKTTWNADASTGSDNYSSTVPARYAVIVLSYGTNYGSHQKIFLRQGHEADYLMRNGDAATSVASGWDGVRDQCVKFSPYNLTHPDLKSDPALDWTDIANHPRIPARASLTTADAPDYFTDFPSQAGAFFQWAVDPTMTAINGNAYTFYERRAYHPTAPATAITDWNTDYTFPNANAYWQQHATTPLETTNETCPPGWRRPNDGSMTAAVGTSNNVAASEYRQSLWLNPQNSTTSSLDNSAWGYYADGWFDRRAITSSSTVAAGTSTVAYRGRLFFNPDTNAGLFIPAAGYRYTSSGQLSYAGSGGYYWSSSANSTSYGWALYVYSSVASRGYNDRSDGGSVRCVPE